MGVDMHWKNKPDDMSDANKDPAHGTWFSLNSAGCSFFREVTGDENFPYGLCDNVQLEGAIAHLEEVLTIPDSEPNMKDLEKWCLAPDYPWRRAVEDVLTYLKHAQREGGGVVVD